MTLEDRVVALAQAIGTDVKTLTTAVGSLESLTTTAKSSLVAAINEIVQAMASVNATWIDDSVTSGASTWSSSKVSSEISGAISGLVADALGSDHSFATTIATQIANRVRFDDVQVLTAPQKAQACENIGAASLVAIGDPDRDLVAAYVAAKV